jgi:hypothetical protein
MAGGIGSIILAYILWKYTGSLWLAAIIAVVAWPVLTPIIQGILLVPIQLICLFISLFEPEMPVALLHESNSLDTQSKEMGMRILLVTKGETHYFLNDAQKEAYESAATAAVRELYEKNEAFRYKFDYVLINHQPVKIYAAWYQRVSDKCMSKYRKVLKTESFAIGESGRDIFNTKEKQLEDKDVKRNMFITVYFDKKMPNPEKKAESADTQKEPATVTTDYEMKFDKPIIQMQEGVNC